MDAAERKRTEQQARAAKILAEKAPITAAELSQRAAEIVKQVRETGEAVVGVQDGQPAAVLLGAEEFALLRTLPALASARPSSTAATKRRAILPRWPA